MKRIIIALVALLIIGGVGYGAYMYMKPKDETVAEAAEEAVEEKKEIPENVEFVELDSLIFSVIAKNRVHHNIALGIVLEVHDPSQLTKIETLTPKLIDAYLTEAYTIVSELDESDSYVLPLTLVKKRLKDVSDRILGKDAVAEVLIEVISHNPT